MYFVFDRVKSFIIYNDRQGLAKVSPWERAGEILRDRKVIFECIFHFWSTQTFTQLGTEPWSGGAQSNLTQGFKFSNQPLRFQPGDHLWPPGRLFIWMIGVMLPWVIYTAGLSLTFLKVWEIFEIFLKSSIRKCKHLWMGEWLSLLLYWFCICSDTRSIGIFFLFRL